MILFKGMTKKTVKDGASQFRNFHVNFHKCHALLSKRITIVRLGYHKFCARWVPKMLTGAHEMLRMALAFVDFFRAIPQR
jgi:hypothetical protein